MLKKIQTKRLGKLQIDKDVKEAILTCVLEENTYYHLIRAGIKVKEIALVLLYHYPVAYDKLYE